MFVIGNFNSDAGTEHMMWMFLEAFGKKYVTDLFVCKSNGNFFQLSRKCCRSVRKLIRGKGAFWLNALFIFLAVLCHKPAKIVTFNYHMGISVGMALRWLPKSLKPHSILVHHLRLGYLENPVEIRRIKSNFKIFDHHIVPSHFLKQELIISVKGINKHLVSVIPNGLDLNLIHELAREQTPLAVNLPKQRWICVYVGELRPGKRVDRLLRCFSQLPEKDNVLLLIIGGGNEYENLLILAESLRLKNNCIFLGHQQNPYQYIKLSDLLVLTSQHETFGLSALEAMALGIPVLAMGDHIGGLREILQHEIQGLLFEKWDEKVFIKAWSFMLKNEDIRKKNAEASVKQAAKFSKENMITSYEKIMQI